MFQTVSSVEPLADFRLLVGFNNGNKKIYDVKPLFSKWAVFKTLENVPGIFRCVQVDTGGYGVVWNDEIDLSCNELWEGGTLCQ